MHTATAPQKLNAEDLGPQNSPSRFQQRFEDWLERAKAGDTDTLGTMIEVCRPYLLAIARQEIPESLRAKVDAADVVQETSLRAHRGFAAFHGTKCGEFRNWLRRILVNHIATVRRSFDTEKRRIDRETFGNLDVDAFLDSSDGQITPGAWLIRREQQVRLEVALSKLPQHLQEVIRLRNFERLSFVEIGSRLERSEGAARKLWVRAIARLKRELGNP